MRCIARDIERIKRQLGRSRRISGSVRGGGAGTGELGPPSPACQRRSLAGLLPRSWSAAARQKPPPRPAGHRLRPGLANPGNFGGGHFLSRRRGLFLRLVQLLLYLAVTLVGWADALPIELKALVDQVVAIGLHFLLIYRSGNGRGRIRWARSLRDPEYLAGLCQQRRQAGRRRDGWARIGRRCQWRRGRSHIEGSRWR